MRKKSTSKIKQKFKAFQYLCCHTLPPHAYSLFPSIIACTTFDLAYQIISELLEGWDPVLLTRTTDFHIVGT